MPHGIVPVGVTLSLPRPPRLPQENIGDDDDDPTKDGY